jgi:hypothetical protein
MRVKQRFNPLRSCTHDVDSDEESICRLQAGLEKDIIIRQFGYGFMKGLSLPYSSNRLMSDIPLTFHCVRLFWCLANRRSDLRLESVRDG